MLRASTQKLKQITDWTPVMSLTQSMQRAWASRIQDGFAWTATRRPGDHIALADDCCETRSSFSAKSALTPRNGEANHGIDFQFTWFFCRRWLKKLDRFPKSGRSEAAGENVRYREKLVKVEGLRMDKISAPQEIDKSLFARTRSIPAPSLVLPSKWCSAGAASSLISGQIRPLNMSTRRESQKTTIPFRCRGDLRCLSVLPKRRIRLLTGASVSANCEICLISTAAAMASMTAFCQGPAARTAFYASHILRNKYGHAPAHCHLGSSYLY